MNATGNSVLQLNELLEHEEFGLALVTTHGAGLDGNIVGAHVVEDVDPARWLNRGWVMLTGGLVYRTQATQRKAVAELADRGIAGLGFVVGTPQPERVPKALVQEAEERLFPVFSIPVETHLKDIVAFVGQCRLSQDMLALRRAFSIQRHLMDALRNEDPVATLVSHLASVVEGAVFVLSPTGAVVESQGKGPVSVFWEEISHRPSSLQAFDVDRWSVVSAPIRTGEGIVYWLVVATGTRTNSGPLKAAAIESADRMLTVISLGRRTALLQERAIRGALLREALDERLAPGGKGIRDRLAALGFAEGVAYQMIVLAPDSDSDSAEDPEELLEVVEGLVASRHYPALLLATDSDVIAFLQIPGGLADEGGWLHDAIRAHGIRVTVGVGRPVVETTTVLDAVIDARLAISCRPRDGSGEAAINVQELDLVGLSLRLPGAETIAWRAEQLLSPLDDHENFLETLTTFFEVDCDVNRAAKRLHLHPNSVRYRLTQVEKLLDLRLAEPSAIANLHLALHLRAVATHPEPGP